MNDVEMFFDKWLNKASWSFSEAVCLYCSYDPDARGYVGLENTTSACGIFKIRHKATEYQNGNRLLTGMREEVWNTQTQAEVINLEDTMQRDALAERLKHHGKNENGEYCFEPVVIMRWLKEQTRINLPKGLTDIAPRHKNFFSMLEIDNTPKSKKFAAAKSIAEHKKVYKSYLSGNITLYLNGEISKPWSSQINEEKAIKGLMPSGFNRDNFRKARKEVLATYPNSSKTVLSANDHKTLKDHLKSQKQ